MGRHPRGPTHLVDGPDAAETLCGLPRTAFPHEFGRPSSLDPPDPCATCGIVAG